jgi:hypothetical protein
VAQGHTLDEIRGYVGIGDVAETLYILAKNGYLSKEPPLPTKIASAQSVSRLDASAVRNSIASVLKEVSTVISKTAAEISTLPHAKTGSDQNQLPAATAQTIINLGPPIPTAIPTLVLASNNERLKTPAPVASSELHPELRQQLIAIIQESGSKHLGLFARDILALCENAKTIEAMQTGISRWHIALLESKTGKDQAFDYLQQINTLLLSENNSQAASA